MGNSKTLGIILIIIGIAFIALGVWAGMPKTVTNIPGIYTEQNDTNTQETDVEESIYTEEIKLYPDPDNQESTRYIY